VYLGPDTPIETVEETGRRLQPNLIVLHAATADRVRPAVDHLRALARRHRIALAGAGAATSVPESEGLLLLTGDPIAEAARVMTLVHDAP
jgi:hypothetical protein